MTDYVNNKEFYNEICAYRKLYDIAKQTNDSLPKIPDKKTNISCLFFAKSNNKTVS